MKRGLFLERIKLLLRFMMVIQIPAVLELLNQ